MEIRIVFITLFFLSIVISSCKIDLSRDEAKQMIISKYNLPQNETFILQKKYLEPWASQRPAAYTGETIFDNNNGDLLNELHGKELIKIGTENGYQKTGHTFKLYTVVLTEKGREHLINEYEEKYELKICEIDFGEITGIQVKEEEKVATVHFTLARVNTTPFGIRIPPQDLSRKELFSLFDDGWRLSSAVYHGSTQQTPKSNKETNSKEKRSENSEQQCEVADKVVTITGANVRLRSDPNITQDNILLMMNKGSATVYLGDIEIAGQKWYKVCYNNSIGWVSGQFASFKENNTTNTKLDRFSGIWDGNEATMTIARFANGSYKILYEDIEGTSLNYVGNIENGRLKYIDPDYDGKSAIRYVVVSSEKCIKDGMYEFCKK